MGLQNGGRYRQVVVSSGLTVFPKDARLFFVLLDSFFERSFFSFTFMTMSKQYCGKRKALFTRDIFAHNIAILR